MQFQARKPSVDSSTEEKSIKQGEAERYKAFTRACCIRSPGEPPASNSSTSGRMDQPTAAAEVVPASTRGSSQDAAACTTTQQENRSVDIGSGNGEGGKPEGNANDDMPIAGGSSVGNGMLERGGAADAGGGAADGGQGEERKKTKRPPRVGSVRQGRKDKRKVEWQAKKARIKEAKLHERKQR